MTAFLLLFQQIIVASLFAKMSAWFLNLILYISIPLFSILIGVKLYIDLKCKLQSEQWAREAKGRKSE